MSFQRNRGNQKRHGITGDLKMAEPPHVRVAMAQHFEVKVYVQRLTDLAEAGENLSLSLGSSDSGLSRMHQLAPIKA